MLVTTYAHPRPHHNNGRFWMTEQLAISWRLIVDWPKHASYVWKKHKSDTKSTTPSSHNIETMLTQSVFTNSKAQSLAWLKSVFIPLQNDYSETPRRCLGRNRLEKKTYDVQWNKRWLISHPALNMVSLFENHMQGDLTLYPACQCASQPKSYYQVIKALGHSPPTIHQCAINVAEHESTN